MYTYRETTRCNRLRYEIPSLRYTIYTRVAQNDRVITTTSAIPAVSS